MNTTWRRLAAAMLCFLAVPFVGSLRAATGPATIIDTASGCDSSAERTNLATALTAAGYTVTTITTGVVPGSLVGQKQVWDIRCTNVLTAGEITTFTAYLQSGGSLFLMGENTGFAALRDASLISFISALGGGSLTLTATLNTQTAQAPFTGPNALTTVTFRAVGGTTGAGTGAFATKDASNNGGSIAFGPGSLSAATAGTLIIVWDVNFLDNARSASEATLANNLIAFLAAPAPIGTPAPTIPVLSPLAVILLGLLLGSTGLWALRRRAV